MEILSGIRWYLAIFLWRFWIQLSAEMLSTFNCGAGLMLVVPKEHKKLVIDRVKECYDCYETGTIVPGQKRVVFRGHVDFLP